MEIPVLVTLKFLIKLTVACRKNQVIKVKGSSNNSIYLKKKTRNKTKSNILIVKKVYLLA